MTEFLKNNPIALRHCLLYQCLQGKSVGKAFYEFCQIVGDDVIEKESFEFCFNKFKHGLFDDVIEPINDMRDILRNDKYALRACILYETLKLRSYYFWNNGIVYNRSYSAYRNFRKVIGDDVMEYREFDFWFYRFLNGEFDLNFEFDKDKKIHELIDMPLDVMEKIVEYLNIFDRISLTRTSRSLRTFVANQRLFHSELILNIFHYDAFIVYGIEDRVKSYKKPRGSTEGVPHWKQVIQDFKAILNYPKLHLENLKIGFHTDSPIFIANMTDEFVSTHQVHLRNLYFEAHSMNPLLKILPLFTPGYLTTIDVSVEKMNDTIMEKVAELEQWKQATRVSVNPDLDLGW